ncbi:MAG TPA: SCO family protein [Thermomicrobiales bacterium]|jgi:protein SCO1/2
MTADNAPLTIAPTRRGRRLLWGLLALVAVALALLGILSLLESRREPSGRRTTIVTNGVSPSGQGSQVTPPRPLDDFTLTSQTGTPVALHELRGKAVLLFFGFTNCPNICPTTLSEFRSVKRGLGADAEKLAVVFVSVDPEQDTIERLRQYVGTFDPGFIGLRGDQATLAKIGPQYDLYYQRQPLGDGTYTVDHTAISYLIDPSGKLRTIYPYGTPAAALTTDIRALLAQP